MKRTLFFFLLTAAVLVSCKSKEKVATPDDIGLQVMGILEDMNNLSRAEFRDFFVSASTLHEIADDKKLVIDEEQRRSLSNTTRKEMKVRYNFMYRRLKSAGKRRGINWERIKFHSFSHKTEKLGGVKFCYGVLEFKYNGRHFSLETTSVYDGSDYLLVGIHNLRKSNSSDSI